MYDDEDRRSSERRDVKRDRSPAFMMKHVPHSRDVREAARARLLERGVTIESIGEIVYQMQAPYSPHLSLRDCMDSVEAVLEKRELQHAILVGSELDILAEKGQLSEPLLSIISSDEGLFGVDETIAIGAVNTYGSIAVTTFGYLDKAKIGIIKQLDTKSDDGKVNTFMDDLVGAIAANASGRLAHRLRDMVDFGEGEMRERKGLY